MGGIDPIIGTLYTVIGVRLVVSTTAHGVINMCECSNA